VSSATVAGAAAGELSGLVAWWRRVPATAAVAAAVTAMVAVPFFALSVGAGAAERVTSDGLAAMTAGSSSDAVALDGATFGRFVDTTIQMDVEASTVAWALAPAGAEPVAEGIVSGGPPFVLAGSDPGLAGLDDGRYELLVVAVEDGRTIRRAARFVVGADESTTDG